MPTLLIFTNENEIDWWLDAISLCGITLSLIIFISGASNMVVMFLLWILYHSVVNIGQRW